METIVKTSQKGTNTPEELFRIIRDAQKYSKFDRLINYFHTPSNEAKEASLAMLNMFKIGERTAEFLKHGKLKYGDDFYDVIDNCRAGFKDCLTFAYDFSVTLREPISIKKSFDTTFAMGKVKHINTYGEQEVTYFSLEQIAQRWYIFIPDDVIQLNQAMSYFIDEAELCFTRYNSAQDLGATLTKTWDGFE